MRGAVQFKEMFELLHILEVVEWGSLLCVSALPDRFLDGVPSWVQVWVHPHLKDKYGDTPGVKVLHDSKECGDRGCGE